MSGALHRIFVSYGHRDATDLAKKLRDELVGAGYEVWLDESGIHAGHAWTEDIRQALRGSAAVIALLSPHSVRRKGWGSGAGNQDSVCLDEIEYAIDACRIPVLPVMAVECEAPFRIYRLQHIDFRPWRESQAVYEGLKLRLLAALVECIASGHAPIRQWDRLPDPWDFTAFLAERRRGFVGRHWLMQALNDRLAELTGSALLITGAPGIGKSAFFASLVHANPGGQILAYHCCQAITPATLSPAVFVRSVAAMMAARDPAYAAMLEHPSMLAGLEEAKVAVDPASAFECLILNPLHKLPPPESTPRLILVDALDEALAWQGSANLLDLLSTRLGAFPPWLKLLATTRDEWRVKRRFRGTDPLHLDAATKHNRDDVIEYVDGRLDAEPLRERVGSGRDAARQRVLATGEWNFLVAAKALDALESGMLVSSDLDQLAPGLDALYQEFFDRLFKRAGEDFAPTRQLLQCVLAAQEPPTREEISAVTGIDAEAGLPPLLARLGALLPPRTARYGPFHQTLAEWLLGWDKDVDQPLAGAYHVSRERGHDLWADALASRYTKGVDAWDVVFLRHFPAHLAETRRWDDLARLLLDPQFLEAKCREPSTNIQGLLADIDRALRLMPLAHDKRLLLTSIHDIASLDSEFLAGHPSALLQCCWNRGWWSGEDDSDASATASTRAGCDKETRAAFRVFLSSWRSAKRAVDSGRTWLQLKRSAISSAGGFLARIIRGNGRAIRAMASVPGSTWVVVGLEDGGVLIWDVKAGVLAGRLGAHERAVNAVAVSADGLEAVTVSDDSSVKVWDLASNTLVGTLPRHQREVDAVALSTDGRHAFTASRDASLCAWRLDTLELVDETQYNTAEWLKAMAVLPVSGELVYAEAASQPTSLYPLSRTTLKRWTPHGHAVVMGQLDGCVIALIPLERDSSFLLATNSSVSYSRTERGSSVLIFDASTGQSRCLLSWSGFAEGAVSLSRVGDSLAMVGLESGFLQQFRLNDGRITFSRLAHGATVSALCTASDGEMLVSGSADGNLKIWHVQRLASSRSMDPAQGEARLNAAVLDIASISGRRHIVAVMRDGTGSVWQVDPPSRLSSFCFYGADALCKVAKAKITGDGRTVDFVAHDHIYWHPINESGTFEIDLAGVNLLSGALGQSAEPESRTLGLDAQLIEGELVIVDASTQAEIARYRGDSPITAVLPLGRLIVCGDGQGELHFLEITDIPMVRASS